MNLMSAITANGNDFVLVMWICFMMNTIAGYLNFEANADIEPYPWCPPRMPNWFYTNRRDQYQNGMKLAIASIVLTLASHPVLYFMYGYDAAIAQQKGLPSEVHYLLPILICVIQAWMIIRSIYLVFLAELKMEALQRQMNDSLSEQM